MFKILLRGTLEGMLDNLLLIGVVLVVGASASAPTVETTVSGGLVLTVDATHTRARTQHHLLPHAQAYIIVPVPLPVRNLCRTSTYSDSIRDAHTLSRVHSAYTSSHNSTRAFPIDSSPPPLPIAPRRL